MGQSESSKNFLTQEYSMTTILRSTKRLWMTSIQSTQTFLIKIASSIPKTSASSTEDYKVHTARASRKEQPPPTASNAYQSPAVAPDEMASKTLECPTTSTSTLLNPQSLSTATFQPLRTPFRLSIRSTERKRKNNFKMDIPKTCF